MSSLIANLKSSVRPPSVSDQAEHTNDIMKAVAPRWLYKPPYGYPRMVNLAYLRRLSKSAYCFMAINALADQVATTDWEIQPIDKEVANNPGIDNRIKEVTNFFNNPNGNDARG